MYTTDVFSFSHLRKTFIKDVYYIIHTHLSSLLKLILTYISIYGFSCFRQFYDATKKFTRESSIIISLHFLNVCINTIYK